MAFKFNCKYCGQHIEAEDFMVGNEFCCPDCGKELIVPAVDRITELDEIQSCTAPAGYFRSMPPPPPPEFETGKPVITKIHEEPSVWSKTIAVMTCVNTVLLLAVITVLIVLCCYVAERECDVPVEDKITEPEVLIVNAADSVPEEQSAAPVNTAPRKTKSLRR